MAGQRVSASTDRHCKVLVGNKFKGVPKIYIREPYNHRTENADPLAQKVVNQLTKDTLFYTSNGECESDNCCLWRSFSFASEVMAGKPLDAWKWTPIIKSI